MDSGFRRNDEAIGFRGMKRQELDPGLRRDDEIRDEIKKRARMRTNTILTQPSP
jgi:hypothetical protein